MKLGHIPDVTNEQYHASAGISKSHLDKIAVSPAHYFAAYLDPEREPRVATPAMVQGTAMHTAILEPHLFETDYIVAPSDLPKKPTAAQRNAKKPSEETIAANWAWAAFEESCVGKTVLTAEQWHVSMMAQRSVLKHPRAREILKGVKAEQTYYAIDPETGALGKCRPDGIHVDGWLIDVKSTKDASPEAFYRSILDYRYHVQAPFYHQVLEAALDAAVDRHFEFIAVEKEPPYAVECYVLPAEVWRAGSRIAAANLQAIVDAKMIGDWHGYTEGLEATEPVFPFWALKKLGCNSAENAFA